MHLLELLWGTVIHRPYVHAFLVCYLVLGCRLLRPRGCLAFLVLAWLIAFGCEYSSTRNGIPFGMYRYFDATRDRELWVSNIPFWDSLSFVFLAFFSWIVAAAARAGYPPYGPPDGRGGAYGAGFSRTLMLPSTALLAGALMMCLDIVIDPLTLLGDRWFLGRIYDYPQGGTYFGVTLANFGGWFIVGAAIPLAYQALARLPALHFSSWRPPGSLEQHACFAIYAGVFAFNLLITAWIHEWRLLATSGAVATATLLYCLNAMRLANCELDEEGTHRGFP